MTKMPSHSWWLVNINMKQKKVTKSYGEKFVVVAKGGNRYRAITLNQEKMSI